MYSNFDNCPQVVKDFLFYLQTIKGRSTRTIDAYHTDLTVFFRFINLHKNLVDKNTEFDDVSIENINIDIIKNITLSDIYEFLFFVSSERKNATVTRARKVSTIRCFFNYLTVKVHLLENNPIKELEVPNLKKSLPKYLTLEQSLEMLNNVSGEYKERDYCILTLFLNCGMRLSELVSINVSDIKENVIKILGKGNKERIVYLNDACLFSIEQYKKVRETQTIRDSDKKALFISRNGTRISRRRVQEIVEHNLKINGLGNQGLSTHKLRHTAATLMYQHGNVDIKILQEILGHANIGTTEIYTHISSQQLEKAANSNPLANVSKKSKKKT